MRYLSQKVMVALTVLITITYVEKLHAQFPDTIWVPVTFYDFRSDRTNPEFEQPNDNQLHRGMLRNTLDSEGKPVVGSSPYRNYEIEKWFRKWEPGDKTIPHYDSTWAYQTMYDPNTANGWMLEYDYNVRYLGQQTLSHDTAFKNVVIESSLPFIHTTNGVYKYEDDDFFPLDNQGFGNEWHVNINLLQEINDYLTSIGQPTITQADLNHNFSYTMEMHWEFQMKKGLIFKFTGDDDVWAFIDNRLQMDLGGIHEPAGGSFLVDTIPGLFEGQVYHFDFFYAERHSYESHILITTNIISSPPESLYIDVEPSDTIKAGETVTAIAEIHSDTGIISISDLPGDFTWGFIDLYANNHDSTFVISNHNAYFTPTEAPTTVLIWGTYIDTALGITITDTVEITVIPGDPAQLVIEPNPDGATVSPFDPNPVDTITINSSQTNANCFAALRDKFGNFCKHSTDTDWDTDDPLIATVTNGNTANGEGVITRQTNDGITIITATDNDYTLSDDVVVKIVPYYYIDIKIYVKNPTDSTITSLNINTNQDTTLYVRGQKSSDSTWEDIRADWHASTAIKTTVPPPANEYSWYVSPTDSGRGYIRATKDSVADTLDVIIEAGPPTKLTLEIYTPDSLCIAGRPIYADLTIKNDDGMLIPGDWTNGSEFTDLLPGIQTMYNVLTVEQMYPSVVIFDNDTVHLNNKKDITFTDGKDTVYFLLYYVPPPNDLHDMQVTLDCGLTAHDETVLYPGPVAKITIVQGDNTEFPSDTVVIKFGENQLFKTIGTDLYGNNLGNINCDWVLDDTLPQISTNVTNGSQFYYNPKITANTHGYLTAKVTENNAVTDNIFIKIIAQVAKVLVAKTLDVSGNGYLDGIEITFDKNVTFPGNYDPGTIGVDYNTTSFKVKAIQPGHGSTNTKFTLILEENQTNKPQTDWKPNLSFYENISDEVEEITNRECSDGAGPVIWSIIKKIHDIYDNTKDEVDVTISEEFQNEAGSPFDNHDSRPENVFNVWKYENGDTIQIKGMFKDIGMPEKRNKRIIFKMTNGENLNGNHFLNLIRDKGYVADVSPAINIPNENNQKVRVRITGDLGNIEIGPNPLIPNLIFFNDHINDPITFINEDKLYNIIQQNGGVMIVIPLLGIKSMEVAIMVFDAIGNLVFSNQSDGDILKTVVESEDQWMLEALQTGTDVVDFPLYWHGVTSNGMRSAPGIYKILVFIDATTVSDEKKKSKHAVTAAVRR